MAEVDIDYEPSSPNRGDAQHVVARFNIVKDAVAQFPDAALDFVDYEIPLVDLPFQGSNDAQRNAALEQYLLRQNETLDVLDRANNALFEMAAELARQLELPP